MGEGTPAKADLDARAAALGADYLRLVRDAYEAGREDERREMEGRIQAAIWSGPRTRETTARPNAAPDNRPEAADEAGETSRDVILRILAEAGGPIRISDVRKAADAFGVTKAAFAKMRTRLLDEGLIESDRRSYVLAKPGKRARERSEAPKPAEQLVPAAESGEEEEAPMTS